MLSNDYHHLIWTSFALDQYMVVTYGIGTWISIVYANLLGVFNIIALLKLAVVSPRSRWPVFFMLLGQLSGRVMYVLDSLDNQVLTQVNRSLSLSACPVPFIPMPCFISAFWIQCLWPVVIEQMTDGMLVLDLQGHIIDINPAATRIFTRPASGFCGKSIMEIMPSERMLDTARPLRLPEQSLPAILEQTTACPLFR